MVAVRMQIKNNEHIPVLLNESISALAIQPEGVYVDATFGRGGHSEAILAELNQHGKLLAFDQDTSAIEYGKRHFSNEPRLFLIHSSFSNLSLELQRYLGSAEKVIDGILFDLGVSSPQLMNPLRGFSFRLDGPLDMRMNTQSGLTAKEWLDSITEEELANVLWQYGEERFSRRIAKAIIASRHAIHTTQELAACVEKAIPVRSYDKHPATKTFQAIRIAVNQELSILENSLQQALDALKAGGRLCVISFHSLEDRIVKQFIRKHAKPIDLPRGIAIRTREFVGKLKLMGSKIKPSFGEIERNPKARSATLRVAEKLS